LVVISNWENSLWRNLERRRTMEETPEEKAKSFLAQLRVIREASDTLQREVEKLLTKKLDPNTDAGRIVGDIRRLQQVLQRDLTGLEITVKEQGGFRPWVEGLLGRKS